MSKIRHKSFTFDARIDIRTMATIVLFFRKNNIPVTSRGSVGRMALEWFGEIITDNSPELRIDDPHEALHILTSCNIRPPERSMKALQRHLALNSLSSTISEFQQCPGRIKQEVSEDPKAISAIAQQVKEKIQAQDEEIKAREREAFINQAQTDLKSE